MFTVYKYVVEQVQVKKQVRGNMKVKLESDGSYDEFEVVSSSKGVLVLRHTYDATDIYVSDDLRRFEAVRTNPVFPDTVTIVSNGKEYPVEQCDEEIYYTVQETKQAKKNVQIKVGDELEVFGNYNYDNGKVIAVNEVQLVLELESKMDNTYIVFNRDTTATANDIEYEVKNVNYV